MASVLPIVGTVAGSFFGPVGGAIGGAAGSAIGSMIENEGEFSGEDALKAGISGIAGYGAGGGFNSLFGGAADAAGKGAASGIAAGASKAPMMMDATAGGSMAAAPVAAASQVAAPAAGAVVAPNIPPTPAPNVTPAAPPVIPQAPTPGAPGVSAVAPVNPSSAGTSAAVPQRWASRDSGMLGLSNSQLASYGGLGAVGLLSGFGGGNDDDENKIKPAPTPVLSTTPTQRNFAAPGAEYRPGYDPEHRYFRAARGGLVPGYGDGGDVDAEGGKGGDVSGSSGVSDGGGKADVSGSSGVSDGGGKSGASGGYSGTDSLGVSYSGDPWGAGISSFGSSKGPEAGPSGGMGGGLGGGESTEQARGYYSGPTGYTPAPGPQMAQQAAQREYIPAPAGYRPGIDKPHIYFKPAALPAPAPGTGLAGGLAAAAPVNQNSLFSPITPVAPPVAMASGGMVPTYRVINGRRYIEERDADKRSEPLGLDEMMGIWSEGREGAPGDSRPPPVLATKPLDRGYTPAPAGYRPGIDPEHRYFRRDFAPSAVQLPGDPEPEKMAGGGLAQGRYIQNGDGDGLSDSVRGTIEGAEPVDLSVGEFVVPASIVSGLGNGSSEAGAKKLHAMMKRVRAARARMTERDHPISDSVLPA